VSPGEDGNLGERKNRIRPSGPQEPLVEERSVTVWESKAEQKELREVCLIRLDRFRGARVKRKNRVWRDSEPNLCMERATRTVVGVPEGLVKGVPLDQKGRQFSRREKKKKTWESPEVSQKGCRRGD